MDMCNIRDLYEEIRTLEKNEVNILFYALIKDKVLDFNELSRTYVTYLEDQENLNKGMKSEASMCIATALNPKLQNENNNKQRCLYFLDKAGNLKPSDPIYDPKEGERQAQFHWGEKLEDYE